MTKQKANTNPEPMSGTKVALIIGVIISAMLFASGTGAAYSRLSTRQEGLDTRVTKLEQRYNAINRKLDNITERLHKIDTKVTETQTIINEHLRAHGEVTNDGNPTSG